MTERGDESAVPLPPPGTLANPGPRPPEELQRLERAWACPTGWRFLTVVNNSYVGVIYIGTAMLFFVLAGILGLLIRVQLAVPENDLIGHAAFNQYFTVHGTAMMFLFAVPMMEAFGVYLLPAILGARDLPFPRLSAYAYWTYLIGGLAFFASLLFRLAPDGGWFMYPPLTSYVFSPDVNADIWLLGIGFIEIAAIAGAIEMVVGVLRTRAPGMSLDKMPIYAWALLVLAGMIIFAFPAIIVATILLELERAFHWPFFMAEKGGDPLLWQHLFWFFGHPEVYIIFLPAAGLVSLMVPALARHPLVGYRWIVLAIVGTGFISFGLWVHHMFTTGIPTLSLAFFSAASMAVSVPSGIQVFSWIATFGRGRITWTVPSLFILGFLFIFVLGGLTGVMVAVIPFDWQVHDTYFVVAHFHYVLIGGMVFPLFAALYYWWPQLNGQTLSHRLGVWAFGLMFAGFNIAFFPMHLTGLLGMPRRVYTYPAGLGWEWLNMISTLGAFILAAGVALVLFDMLRRFGLRGRVDADPWDAGTLEWLPSDNYGTRSIPLVHTRDPLWEQPDLARQVDAGHHFLPGPVTAAGRETLITSPLDARPQYVMRLPGPTWVPLLAAVTTAAFFLLLAFKLVAIAIVAGVLTVVLYCVWMWGSDQGEDEPPVDIGAGIRLPVDRSGPQSHSWWGVVTLLLVDGTGFAALVWSYVFLWTVSPEVWPAGDARMAPLWWLAAGAALWVAAGGCFAWARRALRRNAHGMLRLALLAGLGVMGAAYAATLYPQWGVAGLDPTEDAYAAIVFALLSWQGFHVGVLTVMVLYTLARSLSGRLHAQRRLTFDNTMLMWGYMVGQGLVVIGLIHLFPRAVG
ncbi:cytochrome c oxidase subunit I [Azospirillum halopraeferens]|uniref:cytochrome c oxidase subunit I n=1 Tax=Azospirillum halopraeferens TaxID=34010 RepID=UPI00040C7328|nr:cytochrome c oxidase subunit I [Azospirillum halopraeferens]